MRGRAHRPAGASLSQITTSTVVVTAHNVQVSRTYTVVVRKSGARLANLAIVDNLLPTRNVGFNFANETGEYDLALDEYVLVHHRNHLSVIATATAAGCGAGADYCVDFRNRQSYRNR